MSAVKDCSKGFLIMVCRSSEKASLPEINSLLRSFLCVPYCELIGLAYQRANLQGLDVPCWKEVCISV